MASWSAQVSLIRIIYYLQQSCSMWNWGMSWIGLFSLCGCFLIWTLPESPRWFVQEQERSRAAESLRLLRQTNLIDAELDEIERQEATVSRNVSMLTMCISPRFRWPLLTSVVLNAVQQLSGINTVCTRKNEKKSSCTILDIFLLKSDIFSNWFCGR